MEFIYREKSVEKFPLQFRLVEHVDLDLSRLARRNFLLNV